MGTDLKVNRLVFDVQFFSVTIYKVGKCMMPSVFESAQNSHVMYSSLQATNPGSLEIRAFGTFLQSYIPLLIAIFATLSKCVFSFPKHESGNILLCWLL